MTEANSRPKQITVLCILSWLYIGFAILTGSIALRTGPVSPEKLEEDKAEMLTFYSEDEAAAMADYFTDLFTFMDTINANFYLLTISGMVVSILGLQGTIMMFRMRKTGYYLYAIYSICPLVLAIVYYPGIFKVFAIAWNLTTGGTFMILYGMKLRTMK